MKSSLQSPVNTGLAPESAKKPGAFDKRVKRRVASREHTFFVSTPLESEKNLYREMQSLFPLNDTVKQVDGGCEFEGRVTDCYLANLHLRTAGRVLMRLTSFKAENFRTLEKKLDQIEWELYLGDKSYPDIRVSLSKSRLYHSGAVAQRAMDSIRKKMAHAGSPEEKDGDYPQKIFIRSEMDAFTVSLDSSGLHLHKRGIKAVHGKAPLRETLAASILMNAGYDGKMPLIDPMCGTGTFSMEAAMIATGTPPGMYRHFAFEQWPCFSEGAWDFIKKKWREKINTTSSLNIFSSDSSDMLCSAMKANGAGPFTEGLIIGCDDFFNMNPLSLTEEKGLVVINPPYGIRLGSKNESKKRIDRIFFTLRDKYKGWSAAIVSPWEKIPKGIVKDHRAVSLKHGGLDLFVHYFRIPEK